MPPRVIFYNVMRSLDFQLVRYRSRITQHSRQPPTLPEPLDGSVNKARGLYPVLSVTS